MRGHCCCPVPAARGLALASSLLGLALGVGSAAGLPASAGGGQPIEIGGRVLAERRPLAGAVVELRPLEDGFSAALRRLAGGPEPLAAAVDSADDGRYSLVAPEAGMWTLVVTRPGFVPLRAWLTPLIEPRDLHDASLERDVSTLVRLVDESGRPIHGAEVRVEEGFLEGRRPSPRGWHLGPRHGISDESGRVRLPRREGEGLELTAWAPGRLEATVRVDAAAAEAVTITLPAGIERRLVVRRGGEPAAGVVVRLGDGRWPAAITGEDGTATVIVAADGAARVQLDAGGGWRTEPFELAPVEAVEAEPTARPPVLPAIVLDLPAPWAADGEVVAAAGGEPVAGALVWARSDPGDFVRADRRGRFRLVRGEREEVEIAAAAPGYLKGRRRSGPADRERLRLVLEQNAAVAGVVVDGDGRPLERVEVWLRREMDPWSPWTSEGPDGLLPEARTSTDAAGRFRFAGLRGGRRVALRAAAPGYAPAVAGAAAGDPPLRLVLEPGRQVRGRLVGENGQPVPGARVGLSWVPESRSWTQVFVEGRQLFDHEAVSDAEGRFAVVDLPSGEYDAVVDGRPTWALRRLPAIRVSPESGADLGEVTLQQAVSLDLRVVDEDGEPLAGAEVSFPVSTDGTRASGVSSYGDERLPSSDAEGRLRLTGLTAGEPVDLGVRHAEYRPARLPAVVPPLEEELEVVLERGLSVVGRVIASTGRPAGGANVGLRQEWVMAFSEGSRSQSSYQGVRAGADGSFEYTGLEPSPRLELSATWEGERGKVVLPSVPERGSVGPVEIRLQAAPRLVGTVLLPSGEPAAGARVTVRPAEEDSPRGSGGERFRPTDAAGRFDFVAEATGPVRIEAVREELSARAELHLGPGENELELRLEEPRRWLAGRVLDPAGRPVPGSRVTAECLEGCDGSFGQSTGPSGSFVIRGLERARYRLTATFAGFAPGESVVDLRGGPRDDAELVLRRGGAVVGTIRGVEPERLPTVTVVAVPLEGGGRVGGVVDHRGGYRIEGLAPGSWWVSARSEATDRTAEGEVEVLDDGHAAALDLELEVQGVRLTGRLLVEGRPAGDVRLTLSRQGGQDQGELASTRTDFDGGFRFAGVEPGSYRLRVHPELRVPPAIRMVDLADDHDLVLDLTVATVEGRLIVPAGSSLSGLRVVLAAPEGGELYADVTADGRFHFPAVGGGAYVLFARRGEANLAAQPLEVGPQDIAGLVLVVE